MSLNQIFKESDHAVEMLDKKSKQSPEDRAECAYKIVVATVLPLLYNALRTLLFLFGGIFGSLATLLVLALIKG